MPRALVLFPLGSEVRQFGHSGLMTQLLDQGWSVTVIAKVADDDLKSQLDPRIRFAPFPPSHLPFMFHRISSVLDKAHARREKRSGKTGWQYKPSAPKNWREELIFRLEDLAAAIADLNSTAFRLCSRWESQIISRCLTPEWSQLLAEVRPQVILANAPKARAQHPALAAARRNGSATVLLYHTWKDVVVSGRLSPVFDQVGVWSEGMRQEVLRQNAWLSPDTVPVVGCAHFDCVGRGDWLLPEPQFRERIGVNPGSPLLLYIASAPWLIPQEERYIRLLKRYITDGALPKQTQVVVRTNPMDNTGSLQEALRADLPQVIVTKPNWRWDPKINWCFQRKDDLVFYNSLLQYASACVGIPSTVTVECAIADLPTINIGFELSGPPQPPTPVRGFWQADFYQEVRSTGAALLADSPEEMVRQVAAAVRNRALGRENRKALVSTQLGVPPHTAASSAVVLLSQLASGIREPRQP